MRRLTPLLCIYLSACAHAWPSFVALAPAAERAQADALRAIADCRALAVSDEETAECVAGVLVALESAGVAGQAIAGAVCVATPECEQ